MPDTLAKAPVAPARTDRPTRQEWQRRMTDGQLDNPPGYVWPPGRKRDLLGFAFALASFNRDGVSLHPTLRRLADRAGCSESTARRNRDELWRIGFVEKTGTLPGSDIPEVAICDPPHYNATVRTLSPTTGGAVAHEPHNIQVNKQLDLEVRAIAHDTPCNSIGNEPTSSDPVTHDTPSPVTHSEHWHHVKAFMATAQAGWATKQDCWRANKACDECLTIARADTLSDDTWFEADVAQYQAEQAA